MIAFTSLYWLAKQEVANNKFYALIKLLKLVGVDHIEHFNYNSSGSIREMFMNIGNTLTEELVEEINNCDSFGIMIDEVTDISNVEQFICFIQYTDCIGCPKILFVFTANLLKDSNSADTKTIVKVIKEQLVQLGIALLQMEHPLCLEKGMVLQLCSDKTSQD